MKLTESQMAAFQEDGFLILPRLFEADEIQPLLAYAKADPAIRDAGNMEDGEGGKSKIWLTQALSNTMYSAFVTSGRVGRPLEQLLGDRVVHFHHKMMLKEPLAGGAWEWHQDYGYWYNDGFLSPDMASCMIAVDQATQENGCLQVLKGSHRLGRLDHGPIGRQTGAVLDKVEHARTRHELVHVELSPGDTVFFHCNLLHRSDRNTSPNSRWSLICCYYAAFNTPFNEHIKQFGNIPVESWSDTHLARWQAETVCG